MYDYRSFSQDNVSAYGEVFVGDMYYGEHSHICEELALAQFTVTINCKQHRKWVYIRVDYS